MAQIEYSGKDNLEVMRGARRYNQYLVDLVLGYARQGDVIMDFGAGAGTFAAPVAVTGHRVVCIETDPDLCVVLRQQGLEVSDSIDAIADVSVDYIYSLNVLEHIDDDQAILAAWHRKLRPGGRITIYVPAFPSLYTSMDRKVGHVRRYTKQELIEKVSLAGFDVARARYADSLGYLATLLYKYSGKQDGSVDEAMLRLYDQYIFPVSRLIDCVAGAVIGKNLVVQAVKGAAKDAAA